MAGGYGGGAVVAHPRFNDLRGFVDGWDFKAYVLGMLFYRFISENLTAYLNDAERRAGDPDFDYRFLGNADAEFGRAGRKQYEYYRDKLLIFSSAPPDRR